MLRGRGGIAFALTFAVALEVLLAASLEIVRVIEGDGLPGSLKELFTRLWANCFAAGFFLVASGYLIAFVVTYFLFTRNTGNVRRVVISCVLFVGAFAFFFFLMGNTFSALEAMLLLTGVLSVAVADFIAGVVSAKWFGEPERTKGDGGN